MPPGAVRSRPLPPAGQWPAHGHPFSFSLPNPYPMLTRRLLLPAFALFAATSALVGGCKKDADSEPATGTASLGTVSFEMGNKVGTKALALDGTAYTTAAGETFGRHAQPGGRSSAKSGCASYI